MLVAQGRRVGDAHSLYIHDFALDYVLLGVNNLAAPIIRENFYSIPIVTMCFSGSLPIAQPTSNILSI